MTDGIRGAAPSGAAHTELGPGRDNHRAPDDAHAAAHGTGIPHITTGTDAAIPATTKPTPAATTSLDTPDTPDALDALASLRALDSDRKTVNDRLSTPSTTVWNAVLTGVITAINTAVYWFLGWTVLGGHGAFTWTEYWIYIGGAILICTLSVVLLTRVQKRSGIGVWNSRLFWPGKRPMRNGRYRRIFLMYLAFTLAAPVAMVLIGALYAPWWPVVALAPICGIVAAWLCRLQIRAYMRLIATPLAPDAPAAPHETGATHDLG